MQRLSATPPWPFLRGGGGEGTAKPRRTPEREHMQGLRPPHPAACLLQAGDAVLLKDEWQEHAEGSY